MTTNLPKLMFGLHGARLVHVSEVESGLACDSVCPSCNRALVAKKGKRVTHHFAHFNTHECPNSVETALHLAAKQVILEARKLMLPPVFLTLRTLAPPIKVSEAKLFQLDSVSPESRLGGIIADLLAYVRSVPLIIEIRVTHKVDELKASKIRNLGISALEIDLSGACRIGSFNELEEMIVRQAENKKWIFNVKEDLYRELLQSTGEVKRKIFRQAGVHVDDCPIWAREWRGSSYANVYGDCRSCEFLLANRRNEILCGGAHKIRTLGRLRNIARRMSNS